MFTFLSNMASMSAVDELKYVRHTQSKVTSFLIKKGWFFNNISGKCRK